MTRDYLVGQLQPVHKFIKEHNKLFRFPKSICCSLDRASDRCAEGSGFESRHGITVNSPTNRLAHANSPMAQLAHANSPTGQVAQGLTNSICKAFTKSFVFSIIKYTITELTQLYACFAD